MSDLPDRIANLPTKTDRDHIFSSVEVPQPIDNLLRMAITQRRKIRFWYGGKERIAEPHDYGIQKGQLCLLAYQVAGQSSSGHLPNWRWIDVSRIKDLEVLDQTFAGNRPAPSGQHGKWDQLLLRVSN
jgi:hypothetical protein